MHEPVPVDWLNVTVIGGADTGSQSQIQLLKPSGPLLAEWKEVVLLRFARSTLTSALLRGWLDRASWRSRSRTSRARWKAIRRIQCSQRAGGGETESIANGNAVVVIAIACIAD